MMLHPDPINEHTHPKPLPSPHCPLARLPFPMAITHSIHAPSHTWYPRAKFALCPPRLPVQMIIKGIGAKPALFELQQLQRCVSHSPLDSDVMDELDQVVARAEDWQERLRRALCRKGSSLKTDKLLPLLGSSVMSAVQCTK